MLLNTFCILIWIVVRYKIVILRLPTIKSVLSHSWRIIKVPSLLTSRRPLSLSQQCLCFSIRNILAPFAAPTPPGVLKDCSLLLHFIFLTVKRFMPMNGNALMVAASLPSSFLFLFVCCFCFVLKQGLYAALTGLELATQTRLTILILSYGGHKHC